MSNIVKEIDKMSGTAVPSHTITDALKKLGAGPSKNITDALSRVEVGGDGDGDFKLATMTVINESEDIPDVSEVVEHMGLFPTIFVEGMGMPPGLGLYTFRTIGGDDAPPISNFLVSTESDNTIYLEKIIVSKTGNIIGYVLGQMLNMTEIEGDAELVPLENDDSARLLKVYGDFTIKFTSQTQQSEPAPTPSEPAPTPSIA